MFMYCSLVNYFQQDDAAKESDTISQKESEDEPPSVGEFEHPE